MNNIVVATPVDVDEAVRVLVDAFAPDALMQYLFQLHPKSIADGSYGFFSILMRAHISLAMPTLLLKHEGAIAGVAMAYDADPPPWPEEFNDELRSLAEQTPGFADRLAEYERIATEYIPPQPHYYLGGMGVRSSLQGKKLGTTLLNAVCELSAADPKSQGVYLETSVPASLEFCYRNGFMLLGEGKIGGSPLWCLYRAD